MTIAKRTLAALLLVTCAAPALAGKPRRVQSKGIVYTLDLPSGDDVLTLQIEPGRTAWLHAAWGNLHRGVARMGRGLQWSYFHDTEFAGTQHADMYLEAEPLTDKKFAGAAKAYVDRLPDLWKHVGCEFGKVTSDKAAKIKVGKKKVRGRRIEMTVTRKNGMSFKPVTVLFPAGGHMVALTCDLPDYVKAALKTLKLVKKMDGKARTYHVWDKVEDKTSYFVLKAPKDFRVVPVDPHEKDSNLVCRWHRKSKDGTAATMTLQRMTFQQWTPKKAVRHWIRKLKDEGADVDVGGTIEVDGDEGGKLSWARPPKDDGPPTVGWLACWYTGGIVHGCVCEVTGEAKTMDAALLEFAEAVKTLRTWSLP